ncbi:DUF4349 domain-containing protein [Streptomyces sp. P9-2B-2]|uniref:DUF4349 domain-containing protein n=1 Tax=Streptomyces TaxID=1883 RepID=UPI00224FD433|nr:MULTISPECIES: DUF4349 domain-containing protein [Streptomyces]MCX4634852.1 DUF4349 domain-containing protein [Streptomyces platensis]WJY41282.1 DUF4349 domain-containing protein [Streptomyces sp. P9-2B-2]
MREAVRARGAGNLRSGWAAAGRRGATAGVLLAVSLAVAGCSAPGGDSARDSAVSGKAPAAPSRAAGERQSAGAAADGGAARPGGRTGKAPKAVPAQIVRTATVTVQTEDIAAALARARAAVDGAGGYTADETTDHDAAGHDRSRIVLRVPPAEYDGVLGRLAGLGKLLSREVSAKDVTSQVVDTDSRIRSQRASVTRIRALMEKATTIGDIVSLESELSTREANLESLEAQLKSLKESTGMATVTLLLRQPDAAPGDRGDDRPTSFGDALSGGWHAFLTAVRWVLVAVGAVLPFAVAAGLVYALWRLVRDRLRPTRRRRRTDGGPTPQPADGAADAPGAAASADASGTAAEGDREPR